MKKKDKSIIRCIVIEDQMPARKILKKYIEDVEILQLKGIFSNALEGLDYLREHSVDLIFLDINLPKLSGIDFLDVLQEQPKVVLITAFSDYALQGYELDITDYLLKPFSFQRFLKAVMKVQRQLNFDTNIEEYKEPKSILVKVGYDLVSVQFDKIIYIQTDGDYTIMFCENKKYHVSYPLRYWVSNLPSSKFIQVHRSFLVNIHQVQVVSSNFIKINESKIPLGRVYKKDFLDNYQRLER